MAKKRRLSKWEKKTKERVNTRQRWEKAMEDEEIQYKIFRALENIGNLYYKIFSAIGKKLKCCALDDEGNLVIYEVAVLTDNGVLVYDTPYSNNKAPF